MRAVCSSEKNQFAPRGIVLHPCMGSGRADRLDSEAGASRRLGHPSGKSEYSSSEFQGFVGLSAGKPVSMMRQSCCRTAIADRLASGSNRQERHCEADPDCGRP